MSRPRTLTPLPLLDTPSLLDTFQEFGIPVKQLYSIQKAFMIHGPNLNYSQIDQLPKRIVPILESRFSPITSVITQTQVSADGTVKFLIKLQDGHVVEAVIIPHFSHSDSATTESALAPSRITLCVSSQIGCRMACAFCATGTLGLAGNLCSGEILEQLYHANNYLASRQGTSPSRGSSGEGAALVTNIVFMGQGEPLENYSSVIAAIKDLSNPHLFALAPRNITVSTVGVVDKIERLMVDAPAVKLALSLHAPNQKLREKIVPTAKGWELGRLMRAVNNFSKRTAEQHSDQVAAARRLGGGVSRELSVPDKTGANAPTKSRRVMLEYVVLKNINDHRTHAHELGRLVQNMNVMVNLIPFNPFEGNSFQTPDPQAVQDMVDILFLYGIRAHVRHHHGRDIDAACGQLAKKELEDRLSESADASSAAPTSAKKVNITEEPTFVGLTQRSLWDKADLVLFSDPMTRLYVAGLATTALLGLVGLKIARRL